MGVSHVYGRDWGDLDKLDGMDWEAVLALFINTFSKLVYVDVSYPTHTSSNYPRY